MTSTEDRRNPSLWEGVPPEQIWNRHKADLDRQITDLFRPDREHAVVHVVEHDEAPEVVTRK